jgi:putative intracellular protease/amidase
MSHQDDADKRFEGRLREALDRPASSAVREKMQAALAEFRRDLVRHPELDRLARATAERAALPADTPPSFGEDDGAFASDFADDAWQPEAVLSIQGRAATDVGTAAGFEPDAATDWPENEPIPAAERRPPNLRVVRPRTCAVLLFEGVNALDVVGPCEILGRVPGMTMKYVSGARGPVATSTQGPALVADATFGDVATADVVLVPGGLGARTVLKEEAVLDWLRTVSAEAEVVASVCTGALVLAAAGLLAGRRATTHWLALDTLASAGVLATRERVVSDGVFMTSAGVSAGIDLGLSLARRLGDDDTAQSIQLSIEYAPEPPFETGRPDRAPAYLVERLRRADERLREAGETREAGDA